MNEPFVPIEKLAEHFTVSVSTVRAWVRQGLIPKETYIKIGNTYRFSISKVVDSLTRPSNPASELMDEIDPPMPDFKPREDAATNPDEDL